MRRKMGGRRLAPAPHAREIVIEPLLQQLAERVDDLRRENSATSSGTSAPRCGRLRQCSSSGQRKRGVRDMESTLTLKRARPSAALPRAESFPDRPSVVRLIGVFSPSGTTAGDQSVHGPRVRVEDDQHRGSDDDAGDRWL